MPGSWGGRAQATPPQGAPVAEKYFTVRMIFEHLKKRRVKIAGHDYMVLVFGSPK